MKMTFEGDEVVIPKVEGEGSIQQMSVLLNNRLQKRNSISNL